MKELNPDSWIFWFGLLTISCMLLPVLVILIRKRFNAAFMALAIYFLITFIYNFILILLPNFPKDARRYIGVIDNMLDAPLMLLFLSHFAQNIGTKRLIKICLIAFVFFEFSIILLYGLSVKAISIFAGPEIAIVLCFSFFFFTGHIRIAITQRLDIAKTMMVSGILFAYAVYFMVYLFYYIMETPNKIDALIIYFLASLVASILVSSGLIRETRPANKNVTDDGKYKVQRERFTF